MSALLSGTGNYLSRSASLPALGTFSWCAWVKFVDLADNRPYFCRGDVTIGGSDAIDGFWSHFGGEMCLVIANDSSFDQLGSTVSAGVWYHLGYTESAGATGKLFLNGVQDISASIITSGITADVLQMGRLGAAGYSNHLCAYVRVWSNVALSAAEFAAEMNAATAARTADLYSDAPMGSNANDVSGNGNNWTENGSITYSAQPPLNLPYVLVAN